MKKISILNYGSANYSSIVGALKKFNCQISITNDIKVLNKQDIIILPGVGTFPRAIDILKKKKLINFLKRVPKNGKKILGICLGMQILTNQSEEIEKRPGLSLINGITNCIKLKEPHIGWNKVLIKDKKSSFLELDNKEFYFQHSYKVFFKNNTKNTGYTFTPEKIISLVEQKNGITATQFHPEKSQQAGLDFFKIYLND